MELNTINMALPDPFKLKKLRDAHTRDGLVVGLRAVAGLAERLDIDVLMDRYPLTFNLFLLALAKLKDDPTKMGYFQIAGMYSDMHDGPAMLIARYILRHSREPQSALGWC